MPRLRLAKLSWRPCWCWEAMRSSVSLFRLLCVRRNSFACSRISASCSCASCSLMRFSSARLTASRSALFLIDLPIGISTRLLVEGAFVGDGAALTNLFFRSFGNRRGLLTVRLVSDCVIGGIVGWGCCRLLANPVVVGLLGVLRARPLPPPPLLETIGHPSVVAGSAPGGRCCS